MLKVYHLKINKKVKIVSFLLFLICLLIYYFLNLYFNIEIKCFIKELTGYYCPGCGITRMFFSIINLNFYQAFRFNPLIFILLTLFLIKSIVDLFTNKFKNIIKTRELIILLFIVIIYGIIRNMDMFSYLQPTII